MVRLSKWLIAVGAVVLVLSLVGGGIMAFVGFSRVADVTSDAFDVGNGVSRHFDADESLQLYVAGTQDHPADTLPACTVSGPAPTRSGPSTTSTFTRNHSTITSFASYTFTESGTYQITCDAPGVVGAPPLSVSGILSGIGGILLAVFGGLLGVLLVVVGIILRIVGKRRAAAPAAPGYGAYPPPGAPYPGPPPYGPPTATPPPPLDDPRPDH